MELMGLPYKTVAEVRRKMGQPEFKKRVYQAKGRS
jgi:hypothetical protein